MKEAAKRKKFWIYGIIGCLCFGIGDWLLGYVDPTPIEGDLFYFIRAGHGADYQRLRAVLAMALAMAGMFLYFPALLHISDVAEDPKTASHLRYAFGLFSLGAIVIHLLVTVNVIAYSWMAESAGAEPANSLSNLLGGSLLPCLFIAFIFVGLPFVWLIVDILRGKTRLKRWEALFTPLVWMVIADAAAALLPSSAFSYGLYTFGINGGILVWFVYLLASKK